MATITSGSTINGLLRLNSGAVLRQGQSDTTEWFQLNHCDNHSLIDGRQDTQGNGYPWLHVRTPMPANASASIGWIPYMLEVTGYHGYPYDSSHVTHHFKTVVNTTGDGNDTFYTDPAMRVLHQNAASAAIGTPRVYRSTSTYGSYQRMCFAVPKISCCCTGKLWVRWWLKSAWRADYAWATQMSPNRTDNVY